MNQELGMKNQAESKWELLFRVEEMATDVVLLCGGEEIGHTRIEPNRELLEKLLPAIDELLAKHSLAPPDIADIRVKSSLPDGYSSRRIAETIANTWKWGRGENENDGKKIRTRGDVS